MRSFKNIEEGRWESEAQLHLFDILNKTREEDGREGLIEEEAAVVPIRSVKIKQKSF